ncbi:MAG: hypothetical protein WBB46_03730 [Candidatus Deferrimicrobiaceae bacterium]
MERGRDCVERNGSERAKVASVAEGNPPASTRPREGNRLKVSARYGTVMAGHSTKVPQ